MPTLLVFTASPADRAAPQKLADREIAGSAADIQRSETGPGVERPLALLSSPPGMGLAALCTRANFRDPCTVLHKQKVSARAEAPHDHNKSLLLRRNWLLPKISRNAGARRVASHLKSWTYLRSSVFIPAALGFSLLRPYNSRKLCSAPIFISWGDRALAVKTFDPQDRPQPAPTGVHPIRLRPEAKTPRPRLASSSRTGSSFFRCTPGSLLARRPHKFACIRGLVPTMFSAIRGQKCTNLKPLPRAAPRITKAKDTQLSKNGFVPQKTHSASADCANAPVRRRDGLK